MIVNGYLSLASLKAALGDETTDYDSDYERAISAASRQIDDWCGGRHFWLEPAPTARLFRPVNRYLVITGFFPTAESVVVETDDDGDGSFSTSWTSGQWQAEPVIRTNGYPFEQITATSRSRPFPISGRRPTVKVTARWGWSSVPAQVAQACQILAIAYFKSRDLVGSQFGFEQDLQGRGVGPVQLARSLVAEFMDKVDEKGADDSSA